MTPLSCSKNIKRQPTDASSRRLLPSFSRITLLYILFALIAEYLNHILDPFGEINLFYINPDYRMEQIFFVKIGELYGNNSAILSISLRLYQGLGFCMDLESHNPFLFFSLTLLLGNFCSLAHILCSHLQTKTPGSYPPHHPSYLQSSVSQAHTNNHR